MLHNIQAGPGLMIENAGAGRMPNNNSFSYKLSTFKRFVLRYREPNVKI